MRLDRVSLIGLLAGILLSTAATRAKAQGDSYAIPPGTPQSVRDLIERRISCNHWAGEDAHDDKERLAEILAAAKELKCQSLDQEQQALELKFKNQPKIVGLLKASRDWPG